MSTGLDILDAKTQGRLGIGDWKLVDAKSIHIMLAPTSHKYIKDSLVGVALMDSEWRQHEDAIHVLNLPTSIIPVLMETVTDAEIKMLAGFPKIRELWVQGTRVSDDGFKVIVRVI